MDNPLKKINPLYLLIINKLKANNSFKKDSLLS